MLAQQRTAAAAREALGCPRHPGPFDPGRGGSAGCRPSAAATRTLAGLPQATGRFPEAEPLYRRAVRILLWLGQQNGPLRA